MDGCTNSFSYTSGHNRPTTVWVGYPRRHTRSDIVSCVRCLRVKWLVWLIAMSLSGAQSVGKKRISSVVRVSSGIVHDAIFVK